MHNNGDLFFGRVRTVRAMAAPAIRRRARHSAGGRHAGCRTPPQSRHIVIGLALAHRPLPADSATPPPPRSPRMVDLRLQPPTAHGKPHRAQRVRPGAQEDADPAGGRKHDAVPLLQRVTSRTSDGRNERQTGTSKGHTRIPPRPSIQNSHLPCHSPGFSRTSPAFEPANLHCLTSRRGIHVRRTLRSVPPGVRR